MLFAILLSCTGKKPSETLPSVVASASPAWVLEDISGTVMIQSVGEATPDPAVEEQTLQAGDEIITQAGAEATLTLDETTMFHIPENSDVKVDQLERNDTGGFLSRLGLAAGKVLCEVEKLSESNSTFEVESGGVVCGVRGTCFEVDKNDSDLQASTYEDVVEVQKDNDTQTVGAGEHGGYSFSQGAFQPKRPLTLDEKAAYENWKSQAALVRAKAHARLELLRSLDQLPPDQKQNILQGPNEAQGRDRQRMILQSLRNPSPAQPSGGNPPNPPSGPQAAPPSGQPREIPQRRENHPSHQPQDRDKRP